MVEAEAEWLYHLPAWNNLLSEEIDYLLYQQEKENRM